MSKKKERELPETLGLACVGADSHAHLDGRDFDPAAVLARARACGVKTVGNVFLGPEAYFSGRELFASDPDVFFLLGVHPHEAAQMTEQQLGQMREAFRADLRLRAVVNEEEFVHKEPEPQKVQYVGAKTEERKSAPVKRQDAKVGRNDPCPCGSGKKYKKCCGAKALG